VWKNITKWNDLPVAASQTIYAGAALSVNDTGDLANLAAAHTSNGFGGFAESGIVSSSTAGASTLRVIQEGIVQLAVSGASARANITDTVFAADNNTFSLTSTTTSMSIGRVVRWISSGVAEVYIQAASLRSL
jgi:hypothetical protein